MPFSATDIDSALRALTTKSQSAQIPANQISIINIALAVSGQGPIPVVIARLVDINSNFNSLIESVDGTKSFSEKAEQDLIFRAVGTLVEVQGILLKIMIGKSGLVPDLLPFVGPPVVSILRQLESSFNTLALELMEVAPAFDIKALMNSHDALLEQAIAAWQGIISA